MRVLALFSDTSNNLGLDHRLGRQVLKLASSRALELYPTLANIELIAISDDSDCSSLNTIPNRVAEIYYSECANCSSSREPQMDLYLAQVRARRSRLMKPQVDAIIGPSCDLLVDLVARMAAYWRTPIYSVASVSAAFGRKDVYPTLTRLSPSIEQLSVFVARTMEHFKWRHLSILVDAAQTENRILLENLQRTFTNLWYQIPIERKLFHLTADQILQQLDKQEHCNEQIKDTLRGAQSVARVFLLLLSEQQVIRKLLLCAHQLGMNNGEFTFLALDLALKSPKAQLVSATEGQTSEVGQPVKSKSSSARLMQNFDWYSEADEQNNLLVREMFESLMVFAVSIPVGDQFELFVEQSLEMAQQAHPEVRFERSSVGAQAAALHDSLLLAAEAFVRAQGGGNASDTPTLLWNGRYPHGLVSNMHINANGDQELDYVLSDLEPELGVMRPVAGYAKETRQLEPLPASYVHWPGRRDPLTGSRLNRDEPPPDEPECGFDGRADKCVDRQSLHAALSVLAPLALLAIAGASFSLYKYRHIKYQMQLDDYWWKIDWQLLRFIQVSDSLVSQAQSVARAVRSAEGSIASGDDRNSCISVARTQAGKATADLLAPSAGRRMKRRPALPLIVTSDGDKGSLVAESKFGSVAEGSCIIRSEFSSVVRASSLAQYNGELVIVKQLNVNSLEINRELLVELRSMREYISDNLAKFIGLCTDLGKVSIVYEYCSRGNLQDMLLNESVAMDWTLKYSIIGDIVNGLGFIHSTLLNYHGRLKSTNLVLDSRFTVKITDFGLQNLYSQLESIEDLESGAGSERADAQSRVDERVGVARADQVSLAVSQSVYNMESVSVRGSRHGGGGNSVKGLRPPAAKNRGAARYFWLAPEHLRQKNLHFEGSKKGDVYALGIILSEILTRKEPYYYGTNANPDWPAIKSERRNLQPAMGPRSATGSRNTTAGSKISSNLGRLSKQARVSLKLAQNTQISPAVEAAETNSSIASGPSVEAVTEAGKRVSVTTIDETCEPPGSDIRGQQAKQPTDADEIVDQLRMGVAPEPVRPYLPNYVLRELNPKLIELMRACWSERPSDRPTLVQIRGSLRRITRGVASKNYLDNLLDRLQSYAENLERIVEAKSSDIVQEKLRTEELLYQLVPKFVADTLKRNEQIVPQVFDGVTIFFSDIVGFEKYSSVMSPSELVDLLNNIYSSFESIISSFDVTKIEVIIDQFLVAAGISWHQLSCPASEQQVPQANPAIADSCEASEQAKDAADPARPLMARGLKRDRKMGLFDSLRRAQKKSGMEKPQSLDLPTSAPIPEEPQAPANKPVSGHYKRNSAEQIARMALCIRDLVKSFHFRQNLTADQAAQQSISAGVVATTFNIRIGIHSGKVCAGIVGSKRPKFCLIGDTVNVASRMHTNSKANRIQISADTRDLLAQIPGLSIEPRGTIQVKGKGAMETFWLESSY